MFGMVSRATYEAALKEASELRRKLGVTGAALAEMEAENFTLKQRLQPRDPKTGRMLPKQGRAAA